MRLVSPADAVYTSATCLRGHSLPAKLDDIDLRILRELQADGRMTNVELASRVGISPPPCLRRVRALEEAGLIRGYHADLDERKLGYEVVCFAFVHLASQAEADLVAFQSRIRDWAPVRECWTLSGDIDFVLKCVAPDLKAFQDFVGDLTALPNVRNVRTALALDRVKDEPIVPFG
ncbi:DNA-binding Lrp family transcriptional regulator [Bosea sp. OAE752]|jgi:DNA-binding Lrp family transcriptional regulator